MILDRTIELVFPARKGAEAEQLSSDLHFERMSGWEGLGRPFSFDVDVLSRDGHIDKFKMIGQPLAIGMMMLEMGEFRYFHGIITRFSQIGWTGDMFRYRAHLRPSLWRLTRRSNSRIFQSSTVGNAVTVPNIVKKVLNEHGVDINLDNVSGNYIDREYVVQYQETDFNFVSRLLEREGIYYFFEHEREKHTMVLVDNVAALKAKTGHEQIPYFPPDEGKKADRRERDHIDSWSVEMQMEPEAYEVKDYDFEVPQTELLAHADAVDLVPVTKGTTDEKFEIFEYPGRFRHLKGQGTEPRSQYTARRLEEQRVDVEHALGTGNARALIPGAIFKLLDYPGESATREFLVTAASYVVVANEFISGKGASAEGEDYRVTFRAMDAKFEYRSPLVTPRAVVEGPQTAKVVGPAGEEIYTDKYGRIKVKFHWDRDPEQNEKSTCWVSVSQVWAGALFGAMHIPRIDQEVIVDFLEGDPDQPIVVGRTYNELRMPPMKLPDNKTQSYIRSRSTPGGGPDNYNEVRFEDKKGNEVFFMQAEKDQNIKVKHDRSATIGANDSISVGGDRSVTVTGNLSVKVSGKGKSAIHSDYKVTGKHQLDVSDSIDIIAPTYIQLKCKDSIIKMEPGKITFHAGTGSTVVLDAKITATSNGGANITMDPKVLIKANDGGKIEIAADVKAVAANGSHLAHISDSSVKLDAAGATVDVTPSSVTASKGGKMVLDAGGAAITGATVKLNS